ncbi:MAG: tetratricopeptide repeat protein, partial [Desulfobacterales bacterium]|nr:tetratricopeptide repeat protein [Desulfobacterales bacterium]
SFYVRLADLYKKQEKYAEAGSLLKKALAIREKEHGPQHPSVIKIRKRLDELPDDEENDSSD